jgi:hypothetical protein
MHKGRSYKIGHTGGKRRFHTCWARAIEKSLQGIKQQDAQEEEEKSN